VDDPRSNIYLIGPMGSGKTTIGHRVAKLLGMDFLDCDRELEAQTGASVSLIFDLEGESGFRERETRMLQNLTSHENVLVATGGGVILEAENCEMLSRSGLVVYLQTSVEQQFRRLRRDRSRPLLGRHCIPNSKPQPGYRGKAAGRCHPVVPGGCRRQQCTDSG